MLIGKGAGSFKCYFRIFVKIIIFFIMAVRHTFLHFRGHSPRFLCNYLEFCLAFLGEIRSYMDLLIGTVIWILKAKSILWGAWKYSNLWQYGRIGHFRPFVGVAFFLRSERITSFAYVWHHCTCVDSLGMQQICTLFEIGMAITKTWKKVLKSSHCVNITVNLKRIHQYLCTVKFWWRSL